LLLNLLLRGDVVEQRHIDRRARVIVNGGAVLGPAQEALAVLAPLPYLTAPLAALAQAGGYALAQTGLLMRGIEQVVRLADHLGLRISGHALEGRIDRDEAQRLVEHCDRLVHVAQHLAGDPVFAFGGGQRVLVALAFLREQYLLAAAFGTLAARRHPHPREQHQRGTCDQDRNGNSLKHASLPKKCGLFFYIM